MKTLIRHRVCDEPIYFVDRALKPGDEIVAAEWHPLAAEWPNPVSGTPMVCPNCGQPINPTPESLQAVVVDEF